MQSHCFAQQRTRDQCSIVRLVAAAPDATVEFRVFRLCVGRICRPVVPSSIWGTMLLQPRSLGMGPHVLEATVVAGTVLERTRLLHRSKVSVRVSRSTPKPRSAQRTLYRADSTTESWRRPGAAYRRARHMAYGGSQDSSTIPRGVGVDLCPPCCCVVSSSPLPGNEDQIKISLSLSL